MTSDFQADRAYLTTPQAEQKSGLTKSYLARLLRKGIIEGHQFGREWVIYLDSLETFLSSSRKPGPKGPHKKPSLEAASSISD
jgi:excisionase family DNA binding protein